jgi:transcriptional regulator with XRE-family HTH domain
MTTPREDLANMLRDARVTAGIGSQAALAQRLHVSRPLINRAESPTQPLPSDAVLTAWAGITGIPLDKLLELVERVKSGTPEWFMDYRLAEAKAHTLRCWAPTVIPGLLQTEPYARSILAVEFSGERLNEMVQARLERQDVIGRAHVTAVIDQLVLYRQVGSPGVMAEQCAYLAGMAEQGKIALHVLPEGINIGAGGALDIATGDSTTVCLTTSLDDVTSTVRDVIARAMQIFERALGAARPVPESVELARKAEMQWKERI